ncbi:MAG TPA: SRPBCC family protein [bacterium]|nr:SRPBCC family protein [bacterium]
MIVLRDRVEIEATPERVFEWFWHLDANYRSWHPAHVSCRYLRGRGLANGSVLYAEEYLHGKLHGLRFSLMNVVPDRGFSYRVFPGLRGEFRMRPTDHQTELVAEIRVGWTMPGIGAAVDAVLRIVLGRVLTDLQQHMREEGVNLRRLLAEGSMLAEVGDAQESRLM